MFLKGLKIKIAQHLDSRCVLAPAPCCFSVLLLGAGAKTRLESGIKKFAPHLMYDSARGLPIVVGADPVHAPVHNIPDLEKGTTVKPVLEPGCCCCGLHLVCITKAQAKTPYKRHLFGVYHTVVNSKSQAKAACKRNIFEFQILRPPGGYEDSTLARTLDAPHHTTPHTPQHSSLARTLEALEDLFIYTCHTGSTMTHARTFAHSH